MGEIDICDLGVDGAPRWDHERPFAIESKKFSTAILCLLFLNYTYDIDPYSWKYDFHNIPANTTNWRHSKFSVEIEAGQQAQKRSWARRLQKIVSREALKKLWLEKVHSVPSSSYYLPLTASWLEWSPQNIVRELLYIFQSRNLLMGEIELRSWEFGSQQLEG